jgi:hypothetical protein
MQQEWLHDAMIKAVVSEITPTVSLLQQPTSTCNKEIPPPQLALRTYFAFTRMLGGSRST